ncbi:MAG: serine hydrolase domain-containing protein, partial [Chitinophagaceae bacterium]
MIQSKIILSFFRTSTRVTMSYKTGQTCLKCSLLGLFLLFLQPVFGQTDWSGMDAELKARQKQLGNDFVMMIWKAGDTLIYKKEMGLFNSKTQAPVGNSSKWLTAALVMVMVEEGKVTLDDKISTYLPEFAKYGKNYITLRLCLAHMTGIDDKKSLQLKKFPSLEDEVNS